MSDIRLRLTPRNLADLVWLQWISAIETEMSDMHAKLSGMFDACEQSRGKMDYNTGSISYSAAVALYIMTRNINPISVFEVGTFIGKSTLAMALAIDRNESNGRIFTCDGSNDFHLPKLTQCRIDGFPKTASAAALATLAANNTRIDMLHIDGRIGPQDIELIERTAESGVVIALDDFEGAEKGVANFSLIRGRPFFAQHMLIYPMSEKVADRLGCYSSNTTAMLIPMAAFTFTNQ